MILTGSKVNFTLENLIEKKNNMNEIFVYINTA